LLKGLTSIQFDVDRGIGKTESILMGVVVLLFITYSTYHILKGVFTLTKRNLRVSFLRIISLLMSAFIISLILFRLANGFGQTSGIDTLMNFILILSIVIAEWTEYWHAKKMKSKIN
jgi:phosphoglycerol transferase MdoB-like AlkP superfamily enzyme